MNLKINIEFRDKFTGELYKKDSIVEFEEDRAKELLADKRKLVSKVKETAPKSEAQDETKSGEVKQPKKKKK
jgi:topoisomerase IA-like protein